MAYAADQPRISIPNHRDERRSNHNSPKSTTEHIESWPDEKLKKIQDDKLSELSDEDLNELKPALSHKADKELLLDAIAMKFRPKTQELSTETQFQKVDILSIDSNIEPDRKSEDLEKNGNDGHDKKQQYEATESFHSTENRVDYKLIYKLNEFADIYNKKRQRNKWIDVSDLIECFTKYNYKHYTDIIYFRKILKQECNIGAGPAMELSKHLFLCDQLDSCFLL